MYNTRTYRGMRLDGKGWARGSLLQTDEGRNFILTGKMLSEEHVCSWREEFEVDPATVGQCLGEKDRGGIMTFEGDILEEVSGVHKGARRVANWEYIHDEYECTSCDKMIGNIHENPELLS